MPNCLVCENKIEPFMSFGKMPIANGFLIPAQFDNEYFFELKVGFCAECYMVQLTEHVEQEKMFHENYAFFSSTSNWMSKHFKNVADMIMSKYLNSESPFVVEIGSNDGIMLKNIASSGVPHLGIEPSSNVAQVAKAKGINTISKFFNEKLAASIVQEYGHADVFYGANVMCHISYLHSIMTGIKKLLKPNGTLIFEDPYLGDIIDKTSYDQIYDEHVFYFSVSAIKKLVEQHDLEIVNVEKLSVHGGSMRYFIANKDTRKIENSVTEQLEIEKNIGIHLKSTYEKLSISIEKSKDELLWLLKSLKEEGKTVVGYGATSKSTTVINYCGISDELISYITDTTPIKQGKYSPGKHIPIRTHENFTANYPDYALLFAWNHSQEIFENERGFLKNGGKWIEYVPKVGLKE